jgi:CheY-like chemotaxis protein
VIVARDGVDALERLDNVAPALILLDLMMPRMDGYAFADALRQRGLRPAIPIVVVTADGRAEQKAAQIQAEGYLAKPFSMPELLDVLDRLVTP